MHLTGNELTAASSVVAALAIVGGYLGVRSANQNALTISREERLSRGKEELDALKRTIYTKTMSELLALADAKISVAIREGNRNEAYAEAVRRVSEVTRSVSGCIVELGLMTRSVILSDLANESLFEANKCTHENQEAFIREMWKLRVAMQTDLAGKEIPSAEQLNRLADNALTKRSDGKTTEGSR